MTEKELADMVEAEGKRLGLHNPEFMQRHVEIMETADKLLQENKKSLCQTGTPAKASNPTT